MEPSTAVLQPTDGSGAIRFYVLYLAIYRTIVRLTEWLSMSVYLHYPDLNIEISGHDGRLKVRDLGTGEERELATSSAAFSDRDSILKSERERANEPSVLRELDFT